MGKSRGDRGAVHPNDHVNMCQSSNDVIPSAIHVAAQLRIEQGLIPALEELERTLTDRAKAFDAVIKAGRTHLQDATPITLGQEFSGFAAQVRLSIERIRASQPHILELALGGTAVGTGLNTHPEFASRAIGELNRITGMKFVEARNHFAAQGTQDAAVEMSGQLRACAVSLMKTANDIRWLASGPRCNIFELELPEVQPGSSIMPAKVNPVICESVIMVCAHVIGNDACIAVSGQHGNFQLNTMLPVIAHNLLESVELLASACRNFSRRCVSGITANEERCLEYAERSLATCTSLAPKIGYDQAAKVAKRAYQENKTVRQAAREQQVLEEAELARVLDLAAMTKPGL
jgi:fumarate hydratase class II